MKKVVTMFMVLGLFASISFAQQQGRNGLGFEFHTFPSAFLVEEGGAMGVYFPIETANGLLIEPSFSYYSSSSKTDYDDSSYENYKSTSTVWALVVGVFKLFEKEKVRFYAGIRVGKSWSTYEVTGYDDDDDDSFMLAPAVGVEYFISNNFSFGGEGMYSMISSEEKEDEYIRTTKLTTLIPKFIVRFYF
ncbi:MAG: outer membrane beta-barrel protein [Candidatus Marinimicrobia bacterium]|nr:outer membrane beta-barrel protein [Candidatus Neomarinimicrobiota bacterium]